MKVLCTDGEVTIDDDNPIIQASECLRLAQEDGELLVPVSSVEFTKYANFRSHKFVVTYAGIDLYYTLFEHCLTVYLTALKLCDFDTLDVVMRRIGNLMQRMEPNLEAHFARCLMYAYPSAAATVAAVNRMVATVRDVAVSLGVNREILRDILTNIQPIYILKYMMSVSEDVPWSVHLKLCDEGGQTGRISTKRQDDFITDCFDNYLRGKVDEEVWRLKLKYTFGDATMEPEDIVKYVFCVISGRPVSQSQMYECMKIVMSSYNRKFTIPWLSKFYHTSDVDVELLFSTITTSYTLLQCTTQHHTASYYPTMMGLRFTNSVMDEYKDRVCAVFLQSFARSPFNAGILVSNAITMAENIECTFNRLVNNNTITRVLNKHGIQAASLCKMRSTVGPVVSRHLQEQIVRECIDEVYSAVMKRNYQMLVEAGYPDLAAKHYS